jgi:ribosomal protein S12 methylthiotransferase
MAMKRGYTAMEYKSTVRKLRAIRPDLAMSSDFIVGFPGETEDDFEELMSFIKNVEFDRVGVFTYSDEEGTPAFELAGKVQHRTAARRRNALMKEQAKISRRKNKARIGDVVQVLFEGESKESELLWQGRMETQAPDIDGCVLINDVPDGVVPAIGELVNVEITEGHEYDVIGKICSRG